MTTTSGLAWKIPGRAGDSPILGAGLYVDGEVGAAGSTGRGEANLYNLSSFLIVEEMRRGAHPKDAAMTALRRVAKNTIEKRLLNSKGQPELRPQLLLPEREGRVRRRRDVRVELRGLHGERAAVAQDRRAVPGPGDGLDRRDPVTNDERMGAGADSSARRLERPVPFLSSRSRLPLRRRAGFPNLFHKVTSAFCETALHTLCAR